MALSVFKNQSSLSEIEFSLCTLIHHFTNISSLNCPFDVIKYIIKMLHYISQVTLYTSQRAFIMYNCGKSLVYDIHDYRNYNEFKPTRSPYLHEFSTSCGLPTFSSFSDQRSLLLLNNGIVTIKSHFVLDVSPLRMHPHSERAQHQSLHPRRHPPSEGGIDVTNVNDNEKFKLNLQNVTQIACAFRYVFALSNGQLYFSNISQKENKGFGLPILVELPEKVKSIESYLSNLIILTVVGTVYSFDFKTMMPILIEIDELATKVDSNHYVKCVVTDNGNLYILGTDMHGLIGNPGERYDTPVKVTLPFKVLEITFNLANMFILTLDGVYVCGENHFGQTGEPDSKIGIKGFRKIFSEIDVRSIKCIGNTTMVITNKNVAYVCGMKPNVDHFYDDYILREIKLS